MLQNYFIVMLRGIRRNLGYTWINIIGLTLGITCAIIIFAHVQDELTYDHHHLNRHHIYRLNTTYVMPNGEKEEFASAGPPVGEILSKEFPEIEQFVRIRSFSGFSVEHPSSQMLFHENLYAADSTLFKIFSFSFLSGNPGNALHGVNTIVISRQIALKYFERTDVSGESLRIRWGDELIPMQITGVIEDMPSNTHIRPNIIVSMATHKPRDSWWQLAYHTYFLVKPTADIKFLESKMKLISRNHIADQEDKTGYRHEYSLIPFSSIHLYSHRKYEMEASGNASYVLFFSIIGVIVLAIACINFMNLATAQSMLRAKEIGVRKVAGAVRRQLVIQFFGEAFIYALVAMLFSGILVYCSLPFVNEFLGKEINLISNPLFIPAIAIIILFVTLLSGVYPALFLSSFKPSETLKGQFKNSSKGQILRKSLVVAQFAISAFLIACTLTIHDHLTFIRTKEVGFEKDRMMIVNTRGIPRESARELKLKLKDVSEIGGVSLSFLVPGSQPSLTAIQKGWDASDPMIDMAWNMVDFDFVSTYNLKIAEGRSFNADYRSDSTQAFVINETACRVLGYTDPKAAIGQKLKWGETYKGEVIGVLNDFHFQGATDAIAPIFFVIDPGFFSNNLSVKISASSFQESIQKVEESFRSIMPKNFFDYHFLNDSFNRQYLSEDRFMVIFTFFAIVGIAIACLGLYGLATFSAKQRIKEVGVRKVLGATDGNIVWIFTYDFLKLIGLSLLVSLPTSYYVMEQWLSKFPYREQLSFLIFGGTIVVVLGIALLTIIYQAVEAAITSPVNSLRSE